MNFKSCFLIFTCLAFAFCIFNFAFAITAEQIIKQVDDNMIFDSAYMEAKMIIHINDDTRVKELYSYQKGIEKSFAVFTYPARDKNVKYLKINDQMWMYLPSVEKTIKIAGHMLRQSMMGSDFSYEDALESTKLLEKYDAVLTGEEILSTNLVPKKRSCYVIELNARVKDVTYYKRKLWIDKSTMIAIKENLYAKSGKLLKTIEVEEVGQFEKRLYPVKSTMKNLLRKNSMTEMIVTSAKFDIIIPDSTFTERNLLK